MRPCDSLRCAAFPCTKVNHQAYWIPDVEVNPGNITAIIISEAAADSLSDAYYAGDESLFERTTLQAFADAGLIVESASNLLEHGIYLTSAVKCGKVGYSLESRTIEQCSFILEKELGLFSDAKVLLLMGDIAIRSLNLIARRKGFPRVIPATSTYKLRGQAFYFQDKRVYPSYLQAGPSFLIEKSKRRMIAEDLASALRLIGELPEKSN